MPVYPLKFQLGPLEVTGFGLMMMFGFLAAGWVMERELRRRGLVEDYAWSALLAAAIGGILGAKVWYAVLHQSLDAFFSRAGLVWYGGFVGGTLAVIVNGWRLKVPTRFTADLAALALSVGYALGRVGCFLVQDDYGRPTDLPWAMRFPEGTPPSTAQHLAAFGVDVPAGTSPLEVLAVHPTQLYEAGAMLLVFWLLWRLRAHRHGAGWLFAVYLPLAGAERFLVEMVRAKDDRLLGPFTLAQAVSVAVMLVGLVLLRLWRHADANAGPPAAPILRPADRIAATAARA
jgi:phosphatidylglycerol:prolipoprotein diacylglycerol transferase